MSDKSVSTGRIGVTLPSDLIELLKVEADKRGTSPTTLAGRVLTNWLENAGAREKASELLKELGGDVD